MDENQKVDITIDTIRDKWSKTYNADGKPDWSHIYPYYHKDIVFEDVIQKVEGFNSFKAMCERLTKRCRSLHMEIINVTKNNDIIMMEWIMTMSFRIFPSTHMYGSTRLSLGKNGKIIEQRDYYDLWGDINKNIPFFRRFYRWFVGKYFG